MTLLDRLKKIFAPPANDEELDEIDLDPNNPFPNPINVDITDVFDLHTISPREVSAAVKEYLVQARAEGFRSVRIVHGKGTGVQREIVRTILSRTPFVYDWSDAPPAGGGWGATVVRFK
jgi:dsDNA-specific endonuclease/ATPase MutS2